LRLIFVLFALLIGAASGIGLTWYAAARGHGFGAVTIGAWTAWPKSGTTEADPYARAAFARSGELPIELADGLAFVATHDDAGRAFDGRCVIRIRGRLPPARLWTITVYDARGRLIDNAAERYGFTSTEVVWNPDKTVEIVLAPRARAGNWLPTSGRGSISAVLRLYEAPVGIGSRSGGGDDMPAIRQESCP
jgi:hypothetical protein